MPYEPWQPGMLITANRLASISPTWQDWTPAWTTSTGNNTPSLGDASVEARYAVSARTVHFRMSITFGPTTNFGGGGAADNWRFGLPITAASTAIGIGSGEISATSIGSRMAIRVRLEVTTAMSLEMTSPRIDGGAISGQGLVDSLSPWTWASGHSLRVWGEYEAAA
ncbi:hypothetical protein [Streptomyces sp. enrichment culture]|uniref:hypothetical protein n=1 Tax=Streptomyces sp. enrichment culture TaxID=1795815 RepID=UPI003F557862